MAGRSNKQVDLTKADLELINTKEGIQKILRDKNHDIEKLMFGLNYQNELRSLQIELVKLQRDISLNKRRVVIIFEGRDAAGKGGNIRRFTEHLNPRAMRVVALNKPSEEEKGQWYFQRYVNTLPKPGEIIFYDRSWYNRAVIEPVMGFCTEKEYKQFLLQVPEFEHMLYEDGIEIIKFWLTISKKEQMKRLKSRKKDPLKQWKLSPIDELAQEKYDLFTAYKHEMFSRTHMSFSPWIIIEANDKKKARLETIRYVLGHLDYQGKNASDISLNPDPEIAMRYHRSSISHD